MYASIRNIIFDFGGVIIRIEYNRIPLQFSKFGLNNFEQIYSKLHQTPLFDDFEKGIISSAQFRQRLREISGLALSDSQIDQAWNAILIDIPQENIEVLRTLKKDQRLFLLSNTNEIHEKAFTEILFRDYGRNVLEEIFTKIYYSHRMNMRKPDAEIFRKVLEENSLLAAETLFVDDSPQHIEGARKAGLQTLFFEKGSTLQNAFLM